MKRETPRHGGKLQAGLGLTNAYIYLKKKWLLSQKQITKTKQNIHTVGNTGFHPVYVTGDAFSQYAACIYRKYLPLYTMIPKFLILVSMLFHSVCVNCILDSSCMLNAL